MSAYILQPWIAAGIGSVTLFVYSRLHVLTRGTRPAYGIFFLGGAVLLLVAQTLGVVA